ncbi:MAG: preprotein translocase subunit SecE [Clostridiales bacterium]|nr:preprotein translocase subunit SecE [Candidatus Scatonaster coprocaballi]
MADKKKKPNIFKRIAQKFNDVRLELKRVIWPTKEKLAQNSAVVLVVIIACTIFLTAIGKGAGWILEKVGFYKQNVETSATTIVESSVESAVTSDSSETTPVETSEETSAPSET